MTTNLANIIIFIYAIHAILQYWRTAIGSRVRTKLKLQPTRFTVYILFLITIVALSAVFLFSGSKITGRFFAPLEDFSTQPNETFTSNQNYELQIAQDFPYNLKSLKISGSFTGESAKVYLITGSEKYLVSELKGTTQKESIGGIVTGALTKAGEKNKEKDKSDKKDKNSDSSDSNSLSSGESSAQPESPSSSDQSEQSSDGSSEQSSPGNANTGSPDTGPSSDSGAEQPAETPAPEIPAEVPAETPLPEETPVEEPPAETPPVEEVPVEEPAEEQPVEAPEEIPTEEVPEEIPAEEVPIEVPEENVTLPEENITVPEENITLPENITNITLPENLTLEIIEFTDECVDTCLLPDGLDADSYKLEIEVTNGELAIDEISYSLLNLTEIPVTINITIVDSNGEPVAANITLVNDAGAPVHEETGLLDGIVSTESSAVNAQTFEVNPSNQNNLAVDISASEVPIKTIEFQNIEATKDVSAVIGVDDVPETKGPEGQTILETYAIDPTQLNFAEATVTVEAKGVALYKCANWDFESQTCTDSNWIFVQNIVPGEDYTFTLTSDDPAYSETQQPNGAGKDTWITSVSPNENNGANDVLKVKSTSGNNSILLQFDLSNISSSAVITSATVTLYREAGADNGAENISVYRLTRSWDEGTGVSQQSRDGATWSNATNTTAWTTAGGDYASTEITRTSVTTDGYYTWTITSLVQGWVNGTWSNYGMIFANSVSGDSQNTFTSGDDTVAAQRPQFNVSYTTALNITFVSPTPDNGATLNQSWVYVNASLVNGNASAAKLDWNGTNYTMSGSGTNWYLNKTNLSSGTYTYKVYANDSGTNVFDVSETRTVTLNTDQTPPIITIINPANTTYNTKSNLPLNYAATDNVAVDKCWVSYDGGPNSTLAGCANSTFSVSNDGGHYVKVFANDTSGNQNSSTRYFTVDSTPPQWSSQQSSIPSTYSPSTLPIFNITWTDAVSGVNTVLFESNYSGTPQNYSTYLISGNVYGYNATLPAGTFYWKFNAKDSVNNWNASSQQVATITQADNPISLNLNGNLNQNVTITYGAESNATGVVFAGAVNLFRDEVPVSNPEITTLAAKPAGYKYTVNTTGTQNYTSNSTEFYLFVNKQTSSVELYLNGAQDNLTVTYEDQTNVTAIGSGAILYRDGVLISNPEVAILGAGTYNYTAVIPESENATGSSETFFLTVNKATPTISLLLDGVAGDKSVTYGTQTNATASESNTGDSDITYSLFRNDALVGSGPMVSNVAALAANSYVYIYNTTEGANYTSATVSRTLTVNKAITLTQLYINGAEANQTVIYGTQSNATAVTSAGSVTLYRAGSSVSNPEIATLAAGVYNYTAINSGNENYSESSETFFLTVGKATPMLRLLINGVDSDLSATVDELITINASAATPAGATVSLYEDGSLIGSGASPSTTANYSTTGDRIWKVNIAESENYTSAENEHTVSIIDSSFPQYSNLKESPADPAMYSPSGTYQFNATWTDDVGISNVILEFNGVNYNWADGQVNKSGDEYYLSISNLAAGLYSYKWHANDPAGNSVVTPAQTYMIDKAMTNLFLTFTPSNVLNYGTQSSIDCVANNPESSSSLTRDGTAVTIPDVQTLAAGTCDYACTAAATQNYSSASTTGSLIVNKANSVVNLLLNNQDLGITVNKGATVNISATLTTPNSGDLSLTQNSIQINYGASPLSNSTTYNTAGTYTIEAGFAGDENYTDSSESHAITVQTSGGVGGGGGGSGNYNPPQNNTPPVLSAYPQPLPITVKVSENQETENKTSDEKERTSGITGAATEVRAYKIPNPAYAVPTLLLLVLIFAILSLKKTDISEKAKKVLTALHAALITAVIALLFFTFVKAPAITGGAVTVGAVHINLTQENLLIIIPLALIIASGTALYYINEKYGVNRKNKKSK